MKKAAGKGLILLTAAMMLLLSVSISGTLAYLTAESAPMVQTFTFGRVATDVSEEKDGNARRNIRVTNTGTLDVYVRAAAVGNWCNAAGEIVEGWAAPSNLLGEGWISRNGYYYYTDKLTPGASTAPLFTAAISGDDASRSGLHLEVAVVHQSIQADGVTADGTPIVTAAWGWTPPNAE